jgi:hypothetical protein
MTQMAADAALQDESLIRGFDLCESVDHPFAFICVICG